VRIGFDLSGFAEVSHHGAAVGTLVGAAVELVQDEHGHSELFGENGEFARERSDFLLSVGVLIEAYAFDQVELVDDDEAEAFAYTLPADGGYLGDCDA
jgi:hypothetical protein